MTLGTAADDAHATAGHEAIIDLANGEFSKMDTDRDGRVTFDEVKHTIKKDFFSTKGGPKHDNSGEVNTRCMPCVTAEP